MECFHGEAEIPLDIIDQRYGSGQHALTVPLFAGMTA
jgi:hypothetical protein